jgi:hypothetical protein
MTIWNKLNILECLNGGNNPWACRANRSITRRSCLWFDWFIRNRGLKRSIINVTVIFWDINCILIYSTFLTTVENSTENFIICYTGLSTTNFPMNSPIFLSSPIRYRTIRRSRCSMPSPTNSMHKQSIVNRLLFTLFSLFRKKRGLWDHIALCVSICFCPCVCVTP